MPYAIAAGHELTAGAAAEILKAGGNAFDAAISALLVACVAEPCMASLGGGGFACVRTWRGDCGIYDFFCQTPMQKRPVSELDFFPVDIDFGTETERFHVGHGSVAMPGVIAGIFAMHKDLGSIPMRVLVEPAIEAAKRGVVINNFQLLDFQLLQPILQLHPRGRELFFENDRLKQVGQKISMPQKADFFDYLSREGPRAFYDGEVAAKIVQQHHRHGGYLTKEDFRQYEVIKRAALRSEYQDKSIFTNPLPSFGGVLITLGMRALAGQQTARHPFDHQHVQRIFKVFRQLQDLSNSPDDLALVLLQARTGNTAKRGSTTHFNVMDSRGNAVSLTVSNGEGSSHFIDDTDIQLNNMLGEAALSPGGFHTWLPNTRLFSMMAPTIVLDQTRHPVLITGSGGASRIPGAILQVMSYLFDYRLPLEEAVNGPRLHLEHGHLHVEPGFDHRLPDPDLEGELHLWPKPSLFFGGVHSIGHFNGRPEAVGDERRDGVGVLG